MMMKKSLFILLIGLMSVVLVACGGKKSGSDSGEATDTVVVGDDIKGATELTFWTFASLHMEFFEDAAKRWNEENSDRPIKLKAETYPYDQMHNNLLLALQSGKGAPDLSDIEISRFPNYLQGEPQFLSMNQLVEPEIDNFVKARLEIYSKDGQYYGMPTHVGASVMYYNKEIMDEAGVDIDSIKTWDDYVEAGKQVVAKTGKMMTNVPTGDYIPMWAMISQQGSDWFDENGEVTVDSPENIKALQFLHDLIYVHKIAELSPGGQPHAEEYYAYMNDGGAASISMPLWYMGRFIDYMPDLKNKMVVRPMPAWEPGGFRSAGMGGTGTVVTNQTKHPDLAKEFLAFAKLSREANIKLWTVLGFDPPRWDVWESDEVKQDNKFYQYFGNDIFDTLLGIRDEINPVHITSQTPEVQNEINTVTFDSVLRQQTQTAEEALKEAADKIRSSKQ